MTAADGPLRLVLDPTLTLHRSKDPDNPKALDVTDLRMYNAILVPRLEASLQTHIEPALTVSVIRPIL